MLIDLKFILTFVDNLKISHITHTKLIQSIVEYTFFFTLFCYVIIGLTYAQFNRKVFRCICLQFGKFTHNAIYNLIHY
jgi:hypothetical protein